MGLILVLIHDSGFSLDSGFDYWFWLGFWFLVFRFGLVLILVMVFWSWFWFWFLVWFWFWFLVLVLVFVLALVVVRLFWFWFCFLVLVLVLALVLVLILVRVRCEPLVCDFSYRCAAVSEIVFRLVSFWGQNAWVKPGDVVGQTITRYTLFRVRDPSWHWVGKVRFQSCKKKRDCVSSNPLQGHFIFRRLTLADSA